MNRSRLPRLAAVICASTGAVVLALPATADAAQVSRHHHSTSFAGGVWGGYVAQGSGFQSISGSWTMPQVTCNSSNDLFAPWVGIDGYGSQTVEQTGVQVDCSSGSPVLSPWYEMYPAAPVYWNDAVSAGDSMTGSVTTDGSGTYTLTLTDNTAGWTENTQQQLDAQDVSAEAVIESPSGSYPSFNELDFSGVTVNGQSFDSFSPQAIDSGQYTETALNGGSFAIVPASGGGGAAATHAKGTRPSAIHY
ncbi:G1 family glutamic endopeptidase [Streptacidiphilus pinicola]|uniref:G1 family glutamic endopeptidase n=1 Tax=Streptacidiphilus pinicola TaxID=2219663 RepID=UPI001FB1C057|nr:G1 family glutamic endopeptidase [Streptacidiphilus pinicola]